MTSPSWVASQKSFIFVFNVGRGLCIFIRTPFNHGIMYDFGSSDEFRPSVFLKQHILPHLAKYKDSNLAQTIISHPHADHISDIGCLVEPSKEKSLFYSSLHTCPHDKSEGSAESEEIDWSRIRNPKGAEDNIRIYKEVYESRKLPLQTILYDSTLSVPNVEYGLYYVRPPIVARIYPDNDQEYANGLSIVLYYRHGYHSMLATGDINPKALESILDEGNGLEKRFTVFDRRQSENHPSWHLKTGNQPSLKTLLGSRGLSVLVAPHHGLKSGFSERLYQSVRGGKPGLVVVTEKRHLQPQDGVVDPFYQTANGAKGLDVHIEGAVKTAYSVSTRNGHHILITFEGTGGQPEVFLEKEPQKLLSRLP